MGSAAAHTSPAGAHAPAAAVANPASAATPLLAPPQPSPAGAPGSAVDCPTIGPEIRAAARTPPGSPIGAGTLAAAAAAALHHVETADLPAEMAPADGDEGEDAGYKYGLPRAVWPPAPMAVSLQDPPAPVAAACTPTEDGAAAAHGGDATGLSATAAAVASAGGCGKVTPQVRMRRMWASVSCAQLGRNGARSPGSAFSTDIDCADRGLLLACLAQCSFMCTALYHFQPLLDCQPLTCPSRSFTAGVGEHVGGDASAGGRAAGAAAGHHQRQPALPRQGVPEP
jgi:hypothetical protein